MAIDELILGDEFFTQLANEDDDTSIINPVVFGAVL